MFLTKRKLINGLFLTAAIGVILLGVATRVMSQRSANSGTTTDDSLKGFLQKMVHVDQASYFDYSVDLNGDKKAEVIVYIQGPDICGSGGCSMLVLERDGPSYKIITRTTVTKRPIRVLTTTSHGWKSLGVTVCGGGITRCFEAILDFDGHSYPTNPTIARRASPGATGEVAIADWTGPGDPNVGKPLFP